MVFSEHVQKQLFGISSRSDAATSMKPDDRESRVIRLPLTLQGKTKPSKRRSGVPWTTAEHDRFLDALEIYPTGPWKAIAEYVGTRTSRQTMTHAQKYRQKIERSHRVNQVTVARKKFEQRQRTKAQAPLSPTSVDADEELGDQALHMSPSSSVNSDKAIIESDLAKHELIDCSSMTEDMLEDLLDDEAIALLLNDMVAVLPIKDEAYTSGPSYSSLYEDQANGASIDIEW